MSPRPYGVSRRSKPLAIFGCATILSVSALKREGGHLSWVKHLLNSYPLPLFFHFLVAFLLFYLEREGGWGIPTHSPTFYLATCDKSTLCIHSMVTSAKKGKDTFSTQPEGSKLSKIILGGVGPKPRAPMDA